jgi:hypothetical protein
LFVKDIFRKYPSRYEGIIPTLCANLDDLDEPESKASLIWILGDYAEKIDNADEILATFLDTFVDDPFPVACFFFFTQGIMNLKKKEEKYELWTEMFLVI